MLESSPFVSDRSLPRRNGGAFRLASINILEQSEKDRRMQLGMKDALASVMRCLLHFSQEPAAHMRALDNIAALLESVPVFRLQFTLSDRFCQLVDC